ncbi:Ankyrin repeat [Diplonema papillatum]|nr:Ankyrin repeat [Diplonema papillatum]
MIRALKRAAPDPESDEPRGAAQSRQIFGFVRTVGGYGADVQLLDGSTALHLASWNGHSEVVKELIAAGAKVDVQDNDGSTALHLASENGRSEVVKELIAAGAKVDVQDNGTFYDAKNVFLFMWGQMTSQKRHRYCRRGYSYWTSGSANSKA